MSQPATRTADTQPAGSTLKLTKHEMDAIHRHEFGPRLLTLIHQRRWPDLLRERAGCSYLSRHCLLCGQYVGRAQAMHQHVRMMHNAYSSLVQTKATQLTNLHSDETPCSACGVTFISSRSCNVWFQVALLIVHGPKPTHGAVESPPDGLQCEICGQQCATTQEMHRHLQQEHKLVSSVWHESRDSFQGEPVCNHCHMLFQTMEGLRSHINQGRCLQYDPDASTMPSAVLSTWKSACCNGQFESILSDSRNRMRLTLHCQCCPKRCTRSADLSAHLQSSHSSLWNEAQPLVHYMVQRYYKTLGCICNPSCNVVRLQHICLPFWQLAMQFHRLPMAIFMPAKLTMTELARALPQHIPADLRCAVEQALLRYDLGTLWTDALLLDACSSTCFFCGIDLLAMDLFYHLHEAHQGMHPVVKTYVAQLLQHAMDHSDNDCACFACGQISIHRLLSLRPKPAHPDSSWFKLTCELSVRAFCNLRYCSHTFIMELQDWQMGQEGALSQMLQTFQNLAPMLDTGLKLSPNPAAPKRQRRQDGAIKPKEESSQQGHGQDAHLDQQKLLILMAKLLLRVDRDLQVIHRETTFIFYFSCKDPKGVLPLMLQEAETWHQASTENASTWKRPLRQVLLQTLLTALTTRVHKLLEAPEDSPLMEAAKSSRILLENKTIPFMEWNPQEQKLQVSQKTPVSLAKMSEHCLELQDGFKDPTLIQKFHSLPAKPDSAVTPWRLQMSSREARTYELMLHLAYSQVWTLLATSLKQHNLYQSSLAATIEQNLGLRPKGQGKGKQKGKGHKANQAKPAP